MSKTFEYSTLNWVKGEIDETLDLARQALEAYVENTDDETQLQFCATHLHQVHGTLKMVELYGAVMVAEEIENVARALLEKKIAKKEDAYEVLMRAILQLPDYLEKLQAGNKDVPLKLLPLLNDMRAICGQSLLSESAFFSPDLSFTTPDADDAVDDVDVAALAKKLRHRYQMALVNWFRDRDTDIALPQMADVVHELRRAAQHEDSKQLFWVAEGILEALEKGGITASVSSKLLLGQLDRQIKKIIDGGEVAITQEPPVDLVKNLLYYVASSSCEGSVINALQDAFQLNDLLAGTDTQDTDDVGLSGVNIEVMETVTSAVKEDLGRIKDEIDLFIRSENPDTSTLSGVADSLKKVADTLGMIGLGTQRNVVVEQTGIINSIIDGKLEANESTFMEMASGFLFIESSLADLRKGSSSEEHGNAILQGLKRVQDSELPEPLELSQGFLQPSDQRELLKAVLIEAKADIARVKDSIVSFVSAPWEHELLTGVPQLNRQVRGSMSMLSLEAAAALLGACNDYICSELIEKKDIPDQATLENLADAITSIEYYFEALEEDRPDRDEILVLANASVAKIGYPVPGYEEIVPQAEDVAEAPAELTIDAEEADEVSLEKVEIIEPETDLEVELESTLDEETLVTNDELTIEFDEEEISSVEQTESEEEPLNIEVAESAAAVEESAVVEEEDEIDQEILEIFIEEAEEELDVLSTYFPRWKNNLDDAEALSTIRRSFHTLKGSGRMVGANEIGEFAWSFENILNRVIDKTLQPNAEMIDLIDLGLQAMNQLVANFKGGSAPALEIDNIQESALNLSQSDRRSRLESGDVSIPSDGEGPGVIASVESVTATLLPAESDEQESEEKEGIDPVLLEIFTKESMRHLGDINAFVDQCRGQGEHCSITDDLIRAVHTLHGSAHMAGISDIAEVGNLLEKYVKLLHTTEKKIKSDVTDLFQEVTRLINQRVSELADPDASIDYKEPLFSKIETLYNAELAEQESAASSIDALSLTPENTNEQITSIPASEFSNLGGVEGDDDFDDELLEIFLEEGLEILDASEVTLHNWVNSQDDADLVEKLQREIHTLKGGARMAGIMPIGDLSHSLETMIIGIVEGQVAVSSKVFDLVQQSHDILVVMLGQVSNKQDVTPHNELIDLLEALTKGEDIELLTSETEKDEGKPAAEIVEDSTEEITAEDVAEQEVSETDIVEPSPTIEEAPQTDTVIEFPVPEQEEAVEEDIVIMPSLPDIAKQQEIEKQAKDEQQAKGNVQQDQIRVRADLLNNLVNFAGEVSIYRSRIEQQVGSFGYNLTEMDQTISRVREQLRRFEIETETQIMYRFEDSNEFDTDFDPLELDRFSNMQQLSRSLLESLNDLGSIQSLLDNQTRETETLLLQQSRINTELQEGLMRTRMVPFSLHMPRLRRLVRQTSAELKKDVQLVVTGEDGEMDRSVLDRVMPALEHMLRNAIDHGLESPEGRKTADKPKSGTILIDIAREGSEIVIRISDDGEGIDLGQIRKKAQERGLLKSESDLTDKEVLRFILESGFSTAKQVTQVSGRGVGMDVVNSDVKQLGGTLQIDTVKGKGSRFTVNLPLTLSVNKALMVKVGEDTFAIPLSSIDGVVRVSHEELVEFYASNEPRYSYSNNTYRFMHLGSQLVMSNPTLPGKGKRVPVLLARAGEHRIALHVEALLGSREIVVKPVGPQISTVRAISGATILGDGEVALILDIGSLVYMDVVTPKLEETTGEVISKVEQHSEPGVTTVMVVDDSITVRKVTTRLLERNNMHVMTAKDGVDAITVLQEQIPDIFLLDIEMPRMDGYELATHIKNQDNLKNIPIIMITSRTGDKHRERAMKIGVDRYLGKPYQEADLMKNIHEILNEPR